MMNTILIELNQRAIVLKNGLPVRALGPGKHRLWGFGLTVQHFNIDTLTLNAPAEVLGVLPSDWFEEVTLSTDQRGLLYRDGKPAAFLRPGTHRFWTLHKNVELRVLSVEQPVPELTDEILAIIPKTELVVTTVNQYERGLLYLQGRFERMLAPGQYALWSHPQARVAITTLDMRLQQIQIVGQELMTRDKVTLRLNLTVEYAPADPPVLLHTVANVADTLYLFAQLAARDYVAGVTLDEMLEGRDAMTRFLLAQVQPKAVDLGVDVHRVGVKDVVLPGEMKSLLNRVIEAEKAAAANVITRREDAAATRSMANTAKVIADNPMLLKLKQIEAIKDIAGEVGEIKMNLGADALEKLKSVLE